MFSLVFLRFIFLISMVVIFYRWFYIYADLNLVRFLIMVILFIASIGLLTLSPSLLRVIFGWDGLGVTSFLLVVYYNNVSSLRSGLITIYTNRLGDVFILFRFFFIFSLGWFINDLYLYYLSALFSIFLLLAGITKRAQIPFSSWLPAAMSAPTPVSSLVHSSTLVTAGVYLFIRFYYIIRVFYLRIFFVILSILTSFSAGVIACVERDLKKLVAISTLSQLGILIFCVSMGHILFSFFHIVSHALFKSLLFLCCGFFILIGLGNQDMRFIGNKYNLRKSIFFMLLLSALSLCGFPFLAGFFSKDLIIDFIFNERLTFFITFMFLLSCLLSLVYRFKFVKIGLVRFYLGFYSVYTFISFYMVLSLSFLFGWSIVLGKILTFLIIDGEIFILFFLIKIFGVLFFFLLLIFSLLASLIFTPKVLVFFFTDILNINWYSSRYLTKNVFFRYVIIVGEVFWLEIYGAKGANKVIEVSKNIFLFNFKYFAVSFIFLISMLFFFFFYTI